MTVSTSPTSATPGRNDNPRSKPKANTKTLRVRTMGGLLRGNFPTPGWLLEPILKDGQSCMIWAAPAVGKSLLALSIALAVAAGGGFGPWSAPGSRKVLLFDGELAMPTLVARIRDLSRAIQGGDLKTAESHLLVVARNDQPDEVDFPDIATPEGLDAVFKMAKHHGAELVIFDNLATLATVKDENNASELTPILKGLLRFKAAGMATLVVHHANKGGNDFRGSSNLATTFEVIIGLTRKNDVLAETTGGARFALDFTKFRDERSECVKSQDVELGRTNGDPEWLFHASEGELRQAIAHIIKAGKVSSPQELGQHLPKRLWPSSNRLTGKPPAKSWCYDRFNEAVAAGAIDRNQASNAMRAARDNPPEFDDDPATERDF
jgi:hypothetical protein